jgi:hypothetical protein
MPLVVSFVSTTSAAAQLRGSKSSLHSWCAFGRTWHKLVWGFAALVASCSANDINDAAPFRPPDASGDTTADSLDANLRDQSRTEGAAEAAPCVARNCAALGANCGTALDGCGGTITCGACVDTEHCGGGGPNKCGTNGCTSRTCAQLNASCGLASDGCGAVLNCGACPAPLSCGASNLENQCGCRAKTCADLGASCGSVPDGCAGVLTCGTCPAGQVCGAAGPNKCGVGTCTTLQTCAGAHATCGYISDGCSQAVNCGSCKGPDECGGSGVPNQCGCIPKTCAQLGASCGSVKDVCGNTIDCGTCASTDTCGAAGAPNQCGCSCTLPHATTSCQAGVCSIVACDSGWGDCDKSSPNGASNGCETDLSGLPSSDPCRRVNGVCGASNGQNLTSAPTTGLCAAGDSSAVKGSGPWTWTCNGLNGGTAADCSANLLVDGVCGSSHGKNLSSAPTANLCDGGTASAVVGSGPWDWTCNGQNGGKTVQCSAGLLIDGVCGPSHGQSLTSTPTTGLCASGTPTTVVGTGPWVWSCNGQNGGANVNCEADRLVNGACGVDNGSSLLSTPTNLCSAGIPSAVTGSGPWSWTCDGQSGGTTASCSAQKMVNGACGSDNGKLLLSTPTQLCSAGTPTGVSGTGPWNWSCNGVNGGSNAPCLASYGANGQCGANKGECAVGAASAVTADTSSGYFWRWTCGPVGAGSMANCEAEIWLYGGHHKASECPPGTFCMCSASGACGSGGCGWCAGWYGADQPYCVQYIRNGGCVAGFGAGWQGMSSCSYMYGCY